MLQWLNGHIHRNYHRGPPVINTMNHRYCDREFQQGKIRKITRQIEHHNFRDPKETETRLRGEHNTRHRKEKLSQRPQEPMVLQQQSAVGSFEVPALLTTGGRNSSVGSAWARCPQCHRFDPPLGTFSGRGDFSLGVNMGSNSIPPKSPSDESINRGLVCAHMHFIAWTQKILMFMS